MRPDVLPEFAFRQREGRSGVGVVAFPRIPISEHLDKVVRDRGRRALAEEVLLENTRSVGFPTEVGKSVGPNAAPEVGHHVVLGDGHVLVGRVGEDLAETSPAGPLVTSGRHARNKRIPDRSLDELHEGIVHGTVRSVLQGCGDGVEHVNEERLVDVRIGRGGVTAVFEQQIDELARLPQKLGGAPPRVLDCLEKRLDERFLRSQGSRSLPQPQELLPRHLDGAIRGIGSKDLGELLLGRPVLVARNGALRGCPASVPEMTAWDRSVRIPAVHLGHALLVPATVVVGREADVADERFDIVGTVRRGRVVEAVARDKELGARSGVLKTLKVVLVRGGGVLAAGRGLAGMVVGGGEMTVFTARFSHGLTRSSEGPYASLPWPTVW